MTGLHTLFPRQSFVGFDHLFKELEFTAKHAQDHYPPHNIIKAGDQEIHLLGIDSGRPLKEQHFAFAVTDADSVHAALTAEGFTPSSIRDIPNICRQFFTHDPSGNMIEFNQRL